MKRSARVFLAWLGVALCTLAIFCVVPLARVIQRFVSDHGGRVLFGYSVIAAAALFFLFLAQLLYFRLRIRALNRYVWLGAVTAVYIVMTVRLWEGPEEAVHFLEYGLLGFFLYRALRLSIPDRSVYLAAFLTGSIVGVFDEILQWAVPGRYWDIRDVGLNALACGLFQIALWKGIQPPLVSARVRLKSVRTSSRLLASVLILIGLCLSNTPLAVRAYTRALPFLSFLRGEEAMSEFKHRHRDPAVGEFFSRLILDDLAEQDRSRCSEFGGVLTAWKDRDYAEFLRFFPGSVHPFLHEMRVHVFRRDRRLERALASQDPEIRDANLFIAFKENLILERHFRCSLARSPYKWPEDLTERVSSQVDREAFYRSPVSAGLFAALSTGAVWAIIGLALLALTLLNTVVFPRFFDGVKPSIGNG